jgi:site-specific DNA-methyltransferase (adenine-specific)
MMPDYDLHHGDCLDIMAGLDLSHVDAVLCDPPYGCAEDTNRARFTAGPGMTGPASTMSHDTITGDDAPFNPTHLLTYPKVIIWGYQFFADKLPQGTINVWQKKSSNALGKFLSDGELAWQKGGKGVYIYEHQWNGFWRDSEHETRGKPLHPTQKPVVLMRWCLDRLKLEPGATVLDPYMGSGPVGVACAEAGFKYIGIEIEEDYYKIAKSRIKAAYEQTSLFT